MSYWGAVDLISVSLSVPIVRGGRKRGIEGIEAVKCKYCCSDIPSSRRVTAGMWSAVQLVVPLDVFFACSFRDRSFRSCSRSRSFKRKVNSPALLFMFPFPSLTPHSRDVTCLVHMYTIVLLHGTRTTHHTQGLSARGSQGWPARGAETRPFGILRLRLAVLPRHSLGGVCLQLHPHQHCRGCQR